MAPDDSREDAALGRRISERGDPAAEAELCRRLSPRIRAYGLRHLRDEVSASDLAQHVVVVVLEALRAGKVDDAERLPAFVMGTCRNTVLDWKKGDRRHAVLLERFGPALAAPVEVETLTLDTTRLVHCLAELPPRERTIVALTYFADDDADEIGRTLMMSSGNVRVARHRALAHLHECITRGEVA